LDDPEFVFVELEEYLGNGTGISDRKFRVASIVKELLSLDPGSKWEKIGQKYLADMFDVDRKTIQRDMALLVKYNLVSASKGYRPTTKLVRFQNYIDKNRPGFFDVDPMTYYM
jgi:hypothetical protein